MVAGAHGLKGALRFRPDNPGASAAAVLARVFIATATGVREYRLAAASPLGRGTMRLVVEGIADAKAADELRGAAVMAAESDLPLPGLNEFYYYRAIGCAAVLTDGRMLGTVEEIFNTGANDVLVVRATDGREILVPAIADVVKAMDFDARRVTIDPVPGLLD